MALASTMSTSLFPVDDSKKYTSAQAKAVDCVVRARNSHQSQSWGWTVAPADSARRSCTHARTCLVSSEIDCPKSGAFSPGSARSRRRLSSSKNCKCSYRTGQARLAIYSISSNTLIKRPHCRVLRLRPSCLIPKARIPNDPTACITR